MLKDNRGVAALMVVVIIGAAVLLMSYSASLLGIGELDMGYVSQRGHEALALAEGCAEEALIRLRFNQNYTGSTLNIGDNSCIIFVTGDTNNKIISVNSTVDKYHKAIKVTASISSSTVQISGWEEISL